MNINTFIISVKAAQRSKRIKMTFKAIVCIFVIAGCRISQCQGQLNDGHYDEEDGEFDGRFIYRKI